MIAGIWLCAGLPQCWPATGSGRLLWLRTAGAVGIAVLSLAGLRLIRVPLPGLSQDAERYAAAIESEFQGMQPERVLLDHGSWIYLRSGTVMYDRSSVAGELGGTQTGDFSGMLGRIREHYYRRILMRDLLTPDFGYDHGLWKASSGIREALLKYYRVVRTIPRVADNRDDPIGLREISVLEPRSP